MIYLDHGATAFPKAPGVAAAMFEALGRCANPGRGGYPAAMAAAEEVYACRELASKLFDCQPEQVVFTSSCTQGLNTAIRTLVKPGDRVVITGFEHNAVTRPLHGLGADMVVAGRKLFDWEDTLTCWEAALKTRPVAAVFTHVSNVFGYVLPIEQMAELCRKYRVPFLVDGAQSAGMLPLKLEELGADFIAMPGHKGLLGPHGTGALWVRKDVQLAPLRQGGTGSASESMIQPGMMPDSLESGTLNLPGIAGLRAGMAVALTEMNGTHERIVGMCDFMREALLELPNVRVYTPRGASLVSFNVEGVGSQIAASMLDQAGIAVRGGLHCAPGVHRFLHTLEGGCVRVSPGRENTRDQCAKLVREISHMTR